MPDDRLQATYIGGPTVLLEMGGLRLLTDPTFDPEGSEYPTPVYTLRKVSGPAVSADALGELDAVLLSHDHHFDNRHGPEGGDRGPVIGFVLAWSDDPQHSVYISGDTVWYDGVAEVARRFHVGTAFLFVGAARVREVGPAHLTFTADEAVEAARAFPDAAIVPLHSEGWAHFSEGRAELERAFARAGIGERVRWLAPGERTLLSTGTGTR